MAGAVHRRRRPISRRSVDTFGFLIRYSRSRDAYIVRGIGRWVGPIYVLRSSGGQPTTAERQQSSPFDLEDFDELDLEDDLPVHVDRSDVLRRSVDGAGAHEVRPEIGRARPVERTGVGELLLSRAVGGRRPPSAPAGMPWSVLKLDFAPSTEQPSAVRVLLASCLALGGSLLADALLVAIGTALFPATKGYSHFGFTDYAKLTTIGVVVACVAWPVVTRLTSTPRALFFRLAIVVTLVLFLPDLFILYKGQSADAVGTLMCMHVAIALVTYTALVRIAPSGRRVVSATSYESTTR